jgi:hypothetical protein
MSIALSLSSCSKISTPESEFKDLFSELSVGAPQYQTFSNFFRPPDALKGDVCNADFIQSEDQFRLFASRLGVSPEKILSSTGSPNNDWIKVNSKLNPKYPWMIKVEARASGSVTNAYEVHIEGIQPYD